MSCHVMSVLFVCLSVCLSVRLSAEAASLAAVVLFRWLAGWWLAATPTFVCSSLGGCHTLNVYALSLSVRLRNFQTVKR